MWEFLLKYPAGMFARGEITLSASGWPYLAMVLAAAVAIPTVLYYRRATTGMRAVDRSILSLTRTTTIALLVLALFQPVLTVSNIVSQRNVVAVLLDDSISMRIADQDGAPRAEFMGRAFHPQSGELTKALSRRHEPRFFKFAGDTTALTLREDMTFAGPRTDLGQALDNLREQIDVQSLAALVVVSDGALTRAAPLNETLSAYRAADVPITTVAVGQSNFARDMEVSAVSMPRRVLKDSAIVADVVVTQRGFDNQSIKLLIEDDGRLIAVEEVSLSADQPATTIRARFTAKEAGIRRLRFHVVPAEDEVLVENNARETLLEVDTQRQRILYFEGEPRFELKFLRRAVAKDQNLRVVSLVRTAESKYYRLGIDNPQELAEGFPKSAEELFGYRGLILGSVEAGYFSPEQLTLIADFVSRRGGGLLVLGGRRALTQGGYGNTPVAELLPVVLNTRRVDPILSAVNVRPTAAGFGHPIGQLGAGGADALSWKTLPPLTVLHPLYQSKPGASTLLEGLTPDLAQPVTVLAEQRYGRGRAMVLNVQNAWTWQMHQDMPLDDQTHETLWRQLLRALVRSVPDAVTIRAGSEHPSPNEPVEISAEVLDASFHPRNDASVRLVVHTPIGDRLELPMTWDASRDGVYRLQLTPEQAGIYEMTVEARSGEKQVTGKMHLPVGILTPDHYRAEMREGILRRIAVETDGHFYRAGDVGALADEIPLSQSGVSVQERLPLWDMPVIFLLLVTLLGFEWLYRRWRGLV
ncbi:MAG: hypothetical protein GWP69_16755 [Gammaproteobacteria bacterium]|nr:hypothetical protein [Gammaproteobacteria bacterium]